MAARKVAGMGGKKKGGKKAKPEVSNTFYYLTDI
jgi:hypothetical protein